MTLTRGIAMLRDTDNATCHTHQPDTWHFILFFQKIKKKLKKSKKSHTDTWHID